jgi:hypothetical protein
VKRLITRLARYFGIALLFLGAALGGTIAGVLFAFAGDLPEIRALDDFSPGTISRVYGRDGSVIGEFATERRVVITYEQIPVVLRNAIIASEDGRFFSHSGIDMFAIAKLGVRRALRMQRRGGASTITQQARPQTVPHRRRLAGTQDQGMDRRNPDREAVHQAGNPDDVLQQDVLRPLRLRRRGGVAALFRQAGQGSHGR